MERTLTKIQGVMLVAPFIFWSVTALPAYNYSDRAEYNLSPIEDHSQHLEHVANAVQGIEKNYHNHLQYQTLLPTGGSTEGPLQIHAAYESEHPDSAVQTFFENKHQKAQGFLNKRPIIDTIQEHEKYGNNGDQFLFITRGVVNGFETFANFLNGLIGGAQIFTGAATKGITKQLDQIGAKIVGLARR